MSRHVPLSLLAAVGLICAGCNATDGGGASSENSAEEAPPSTAPVEQSASGPSTSPSAPPAPSTPAKELKPADDDPKGGEMPMEFKGLQELLAKASPAKQPKNPQLNQFSNPSRGLRWLARYDESPKVRRFALHALGLYPTQENAAVLLAVAKDKKADPEVRASALRGMGRYDLEQEPMKLLKEAVYESAKNKDETVAAGAIDAMHGMVTALTVLEDIAANPKASPKLKAAAKRALGPQLDNDDLAGPENEG